MPLDFKIDARDAMDAFYGAGCWTYRTAPGVGSDLGAALNAAIEARLPTYPRLDILIPPTGPWMMKTRISPINVTGHHIHGAGGPWGTIIYYDNDEDFFDILYNSDYREGGMIEDLVVNLEPNHPNAACFLRLLAADNTGAPCGYIFNRLRASADISSSWIYSVAMSGAARTTPAQGIRGVVIRDSTFFRGRQGGLWVTGILNGAFDNIGFYVPSTTAGADITITGGSTPETRTNNMILTGVYTVGKSFINNVTGVYGTIRSGGLTIDATVQSAAVFHGGAISGAPGSGFASGF